MRRATIALGLALALPIGEARAPCLAAAAPPAERPFLVAGKFGKALDARAAPVVLPGDDRYRRPPLTVECWARLDSKRGFNVLVASDPKSSARHWEVYSYAGTGAFSAYLPGTSPGEVVSGVDICDRKWHYLAMTYDGKTVKLYVDGKPVKEQAVKPKAGLRAVPGPLTIGAAVDGGTRIGCDGAIDDVRLSRVVRAIRGVPAAPLPHDPHTLGLWRFDRVEGLSDPAWTPGPVLTGEPWERETDKDWVDARLRDMDTGPVFNATLAYPSWKGKVRAYKATAIRVGEKGEAAVVFDRNLLRLAAGWTGGYLHHSDRRFGLLNTPTPAGPVAFSTPSGSGWAGPKGEWDSAQAPTAPLPRDWAKFKGLYLHGKRVVLSYTVGGADVLESPWVEQADGLTVLTRTVEVGPSGRALTMLVCDVPGSAGAPRDVNGVRMVLGRHNEAWTAVTLVGADKRVSLALGGRERAIVRVAPGTKPTRFKVLIWYGRAKDLAPLAKLAKASPAPTDLKAWTRPGPARWTKPVVTRGERGADDGPYAVDTLTVPYDNPYKALMFLSGLDFLPNGDVAVCTAHGDVWLVRGAGARLDKIVWKRFATGLYHPLGLRVVGGKVHVLERGQLTRLHDTNGDGEADFYENVNNDWHTGGGEHSYDTCLETDLAGNFYFFKTGDPHTPTGGCLLRVPKDGSNAEAFATGFRHPIGLSVGPDGTVTGADQEGNWMPATRLDVYRKGGFYGDMRAHHRAVPPATYDGPLLWLPKEADNSAGGQAWVQGDKFGLPAGSLLHLSYGRCKLYLVLRQTVDGVAQAGAVDLGLFFLSGAMRGRFNPADGQLYVAGLRGWQTAARRDGCLQRVRYTGRPLRVPTALAVHADGVRLTFTQKLDAATARDPARYRLEQWNYRWRADYGSKHWSVAHPDREGHDVLPVESATLSADGRSVFLRLRPTVPVMQMKIGYDLKGADGKPLTGAVYNTVHKAAPPEKR
jgi:hypothetical protein